MLPSDRDRASQKLHANLMVGARVRVRGAVWRVHHVHPYDACTVVQLTGISHDNIGQSSTLIDPFDCLEPERRPRTLRVVTKRRWCHALREWLSLDHPFDGLRAAALARIQLLPFQLEPALAMVRGLACRMLLADEVGLGKTIQAGLILAELRERGLADRALLLTPAGLRRQWQEELRARFAIPSTIVDSDLLRRRSSVLPEGTNPWLLDDVAIASVDLIKRMEALRSMASIVWDVLLVDEAHLTAHAPLRHSALRHLAARARRVVLVSATPHTGDSAAFAALCRLGEGDGLPVAMFRRARAQVGLPVTRRVRTFSVNLDATEHRLHQLLRAYAQLVFHEEAVDRNVRRGHSLLAMTVLTKRALSSPASLRISLQRRIQLLSSHEEPVSGSQLLLPLTEDDDDDRDLEPLAILATPGLTDRKRELTILQEIERAASTVPVGRKVRVLSRFLQRVKEPVIIFTEYRDTLLHIANAIGSADRLSVIHGGLDEMERVRARTAFTEGATRVLLTTDAGGEGLNLHHRCRLVISLELPWNPTRLEQRIGRVDRLGQGRPVHAINFLARGTSEEDVRKRLIHRLARARHAVGHVNDPLGAVDDLTRLMLENENAATEIEPDVVSQPDLRESAVTEAKRLDGARRLELVTTGRDRDIVPVTVLRRRQIGHLVNASSLVCLVLARLIGGDGELVEHVLVSLAAPLFRSSAAMHHDLRRPKTLRGLVRDVLNVAGPELEARALAIAQQRFRTIVADHEAAVETRRARELSLIRAIERDSPIGSPVQPGLFHTRVLREYDAALLSHEASIGDEITRLKQIDRAHELSLLDHAELALVLVVT
jgi:superfamily II DNA or RNA helicase